MARRPRRRVIGLAAAACFVLAAASCSGEGGASTSTTAVVSTTAAPAAVTEEQAFELQARAIARAWPEPRLCMNEDRVRAELRAALAPLYEEILYTEIDSSFTPTVGWDFCTLVSATPVRRYLPDVVGVDVWVHLGPLNGRAVTYLFRWDGTAWVDTTPEETGVTVTSSVS